MSGAIIAVNYERRHLVRSIAISTVRMLLFVVWLLPSLSAHAQNRVALVVGNNAYESVPRLEKAINDAKAVSASLQAIGFQVQLATDLSRRDFIRQLSAFMDRVRPGDLALLYLPLFRVRKASLPARLSRLKRSSRICRIAAPAPWYLF